MADGSTGALNGVRDAPLGVGDVLPHFDLPGLNGKRVNRARYRGRQHLAMLFAHDAACPPCRVLIADLRRHHAAVRQEQAEIVVVLATRAGAPGAVLLDGAPPFPVIPDDGRLARRFGVGAKAAALFVADRHGEVRLAAIASRASDAARHELPVERILPTLELLQVTCSV